MFRFTRFGAGNRCFDRGFARIVAFSLRLLRFFRLTRARLGFTRFAGGNHFAVIRLCASLHHHRLCGSGLFLFHAREGGFDCLFILFARLRGSLLVTRLARQFFALKTRLTGFKTRLRFGGASLFLGDGGDLRFLLAEILHQRNIARADPCAGTALDAVREIVCDGFVVLLAFAEPVELLRQQVRRAGVGAGATTDAAFLFLRFAHFAGRRGEQAVSNFDHRHIQPRQGKAHQRAAHNHQLFCRRLEASEIEQVANRRAEPRPDVARSANRFTGQGHDAFR